jgi:methyltransferase (TIGR00027 family)
MDHPPVLDDPLAVRVVGPGFRRQMKRATNPVARDFRAFMAVRSRSVEDRLAEAVRNGVGQYVILGAGLDTYAYRNPFPSLRVFEVDLPATQAWKRTMLGEAGIALPESLTFVPLDFERQKLAEGLAGAEFDLRGPAFFGWMGVVPYLTLTAFRATLETIGEMPRGSGASFDYALAPETLGPVGRTAFDILASRVAAAGEPFRLFFNADEMEAELRRAGFHSIEQRDTEQLNEMYFKDRADGLRLSGLGLGMLVTAWV